MAVHLWEQKHEAVFFLEGLGSRESGSGYKPKGLPPVTIFPVKLHLLKVPQTSLPHHRWADLHRDKEEQHFELYQSPFPRSGPGREAVSMNVGLYMLRHKAFIKGFNSYVMYDP